MQNKDLYCFLHVCKKKICNAFYAKKKRNQILNLYWYYEQQKNTLILNEIQIFKLYQFKQLTVCHLC